MEDQMISRMRHMISQSAGHLFLLLAILFIAWTLLMMNKPYGSAQIRKYSGGLGPVDGMFNYTPEQVYLLFDSLGEMGRAAYLRFIMIDLVYIAIYVAFMAVGIHLFSRKVTRSDSRVSNLWLLPVLTGVADLGEEISLLIMLGNYPERMIRLAEVMNYVTMTKLVLFVVSSLVLLGLIVVWLLHKAGGRLAPAR
jgi:hypothetical protein